MIATSIFCPIQKIKFVSFAHHFNIEMNLPTFVFQTSVDK